MFDESKMKLWDVRYTDAHGNKQCVRYCAVSEEHTKRLFRSEQERGEVLESIEKVKDKKNV